MVIPGNCANSYLPISFLRDGEDGAGTPTAGRVVEQQSRELPVGEPQQERARQHQQQRWFSGGVRRRVDAKRLPAGWT
jgi:hypothetical protein